MEFWDNVKYILEIKNLTQKELSALTDINLGTLKNQICRKVIPNAFDSVKIAKVLNVSVEYLITGKHPTGFPDDVQNAANKLLTLNKEKRALIIALIENQVEFWKKN